MVYPISQICHTRAFIITVREWGVARERGGEGEHHDK